MHLAEAISTAFVESTVNQVISKRMVEKQQMRWSPRGAHLPLQVRTRVLNDQLADDFHRGYPNSGHTSTTGTVHRTTQMMTNLLHHYGLVTELEGVTLNAFFTPEEITEVDETVFRERDRLGYRAEYIGRFAEFFATHDLDAMDHAGKTDLMAEMQRLFPGYAGLAGLYVIEDAYREQAVVKIV